MTSLASIKRNGKRMYGRGEGEKGRQSNWEDSLRQDNFISLLQNHVVLLLLSFSPFLSFFSGCTVLQQKNNSASAFPCHHLNARLKIKLGGRPKTSNKWNTNWTTTCQCNHYVCTSETLKLCKERHTCSAAVCVWYGGKRNFFSPAPEQWASCWAKFTFFVHLQLCWVQRARKWENWM